MKFGSRRKRSINRSARETAGAWLQRKVIGRLMWVGIVAGFYLGGTAYMLVFEWRGHMLPSWAEPAFRCLLLLVIVLLVVEMRSLSRFLKGRDAERSVGDMLEWAVSSPGCAVAHNVLSLPTKGDIDHVVLTPSALYAVETKAGWVPKRQFQKTLRRCALNAKQLREFSGDDVPVRTVLLIGEKNLKTFRESYTKDGEFVQVRTFNAFALQIRREAQLAAPPRTSLEKKIWKLGSITLES